MAKQEVLNVIEMANGLLLGVTSFVVKDEATKEKTVEEAEDLFKKMAVENGMDDDDAYDAIEEGTYSDGSGYEIFLSWSVERKGTKSDSVIH